MGLNQRAIMAKQGKGTAGIHPRPRAAARPAAYGTRPLLVLTHLFGMFLLVMLRIKYVPEPLGMDAPVTEFAEARARQHIVHLANTIGDRQVRCGSRQRAPTTACDL